MRYISLKEAKRNVGILKSITERDEQNHNAEIKVTQKTNVRINITK